MPTNSAPDRLRSIKRLDQLIAYLRDELDWPIDSDDVEDISFTYEPDELGLDAQHAAKINQIKQLRPLHSGQPWGIFWVSFEKKKLPVVVLRRILASLVVKSRQSANNADRPRWKMHDILFVSAYGDETSDQREIAFAHFSQIDGDLPTLRVLGWDGADTVLKLEHVAHTLAEKLRWPENPADSDAWRERWSGAFRHRLGHVIRTSDLLADRLAVLARNIRDAATKLLEAESDRGPLTKLFEAFQAALIHDLTEETFADAYAQTVTYGLFTAAINRTEMSAGTAGTFIKSDDIALMARVTSPFLKEMLETFLTVGGRKNGVDFDELGIQDVVDLLRGDETDVPAILRDFGNRTRGEDPVIHFYEHFLSAYNKKLKIQRGIFYTPPPVVSYIVRSVHELLQTEFGLEDGLAATVTWGEMLQRHKHLKLPTVNDPNEKEKSISPNEPFVQILDPAVGTATFLVEVIDVIYRTLTAKWKKGGRSELEMPKLWNEYVPKHLLPRLHGYELLAAPYAIAHLKLGLKLTETGYHFGSDERARIYLTNALEPKVRQLPQIGFEPLAHEAYAVNEIKWYKRFTVVIGNPPYSGTSANTGEWISNLVRDYYQVDGADLGERNPKWLQDDYVKFIRTGQFVCNLTPLALFGFITNHGYIDNPTFRGMRQSLLKTFRELWVLDLHGNVKKKETTADGGVDENVFDIQQGVAILLASRGTGDKTGLKQTDLFGTRSEKYDLLTKHSARSVAWRDVKATGPFYVFLPQDEDVRAEFLRYPSMKDIMPVNVLGFQTHRDHFAIALDREEIVTRCEALRGNKLKDAELTSAFELKDSSGWSVHEARQAIREDPKWQNHIVQCLYRPFDIRWCYFSTVAMDRPRRELLDHVAEKENLCLLIPRQISFLPWRHSGVSDTVAESCLVSTKTKEQNYNFPLYVYPERDGLALANGKRPNFSEKFLRDLSALLKVKQQKPHGLPDGITPEDVFHYAYAVFHSPGYRSRYAEFLKMDFPRLPLTGNLELFRALARLGGELVALHLLESPKLEKPITEYLGGRAPDVEKVSWSKNTVWIDKAQTRGFKGVREDVWNFHIGGYQVCEKWLKDRKGRTLSADDRAHYQKIVVALSETIRLMAEIDSVIEKYGGWPLK
jgi:hypothetical protein